MRRWSRPDRQDRRLRGRELDGVQSHADPIRLIASLAARCDARRFATGLAAVSAACLLPISPTAHWTNSRDWALSLSQYETGIG